MNDMLSLLLFAGLFFVMMRFGCGAHLTHHRKQDGDHSHQH